MKERITQATLESANMAEVRDAVVALFQTIREETGQDNIGYVAGVIGSEGEDKVEANRRILAEHTERIRQEAGFPIFSATDIFENPELWGRLPEIKLERDERRRAFINFWREVLELGKITDIYMTPRWEISEGAMDEHDTARRLGIQIHYVDQPLL
jgi:quinol monooxygenase YgiN